MVYLKQLNLLVFHFFNQYAGRYPLLDQVITFLATYLGWVMMAALLIYIYRARTKTKAFVRSVVAIFSAATAWVVASMIKYTVYDPRPFMALKGIKSVFTSGSNDSFPSAHAAFFSALAFSIFFRKKKVGVYFIIGAVLIGLARIAAGVHWPIDILAGFGLGFIVAYLIYRLDKLDR